MTLPLLDPADERIFDAALADLAKGEAVPLAGSAGLWTKCDSVFADYFLANWARRREQLAFLLYAPPCGKYKVRRAKYKKEARLCGFLSYFELRSSYFQRRA